MINTLMSVRGKKQHRKSQIMSLDMMLALFIFIVFIGLTFRIWDNYGFRLTRDIDNQNKWNTAFIMTDLFVKSPGYPRDWENMPLSSIEVIGFALDDNSLSRSKLDRFILETNISSASSNYTKFKEIMNIERYDFEFRVLELSKVQKQGMVSGKNPGEKASVSIRRIVHIKDDSGNSEEAILEFTIY